MWSSCSPKNTSKHVYEWNDSNRTSTKCQAEDLRLPKITKKPTSPGRRKEKVNKLNRRGKWGPHPRRS